MAKIHFLNVEEGDCSIIQHNNGHVTMIDICCGNVDTKEMKPQLYPLSESLKGINGNFNQKSYPTNPIEYLKEHQIKSIFRYIQTHPDMDHMDGLYNLVNTVPIQNFWDTANLKKQEFDTMVSVENILKKIGIAIALYEIANLIPKHLSIMMVLQINILQKMILVLCKMII